MAERIELPQAPNGDPEKQLNTLYSYLYQMAETLNQNLDEIGGGALNDSEIKVMRNILEEGEEEDAVRMAMNEAETLKSLIIKTASWVQNKLEQYRMKLLGEYVAEGTFGKYVRHTGLDVDITPTGIQQNYTFEEVIQGLRTYEINSKNYIKSGLLYTDQTTHLPIYGVAVGKDIVTFSQDGTELYNDQNKVAMFTADELSFWQGGYKATSYKANQIDFYAGGDKIISITPESFSFLYDGAALLYNTANKVVAAGDVELEEGNKLRLDDAGDLLANGEPVITQLQTDVDGRIQKTSRCQTVQDIIDEAIDQFATGDNVFIKKTTRYQTAQDIVDAAEDYVDDELVNYSTHTQTSTAISDYVTNNAYGIVSGITITASGIDISGSQYVHIKSGTTPSTNAVTLDDSGLALQASAGISMAAGGDFTILTSNNQNAVLMDENGIGIYSGAGISMAAGGSFAVLSNNNSNVLLMNQNGITLDGAGISLVSGNTSKISMSTHGITIRSNAKLEISSESSIVIDDNLSGYALQLYKRGIVVYSSGEIEMQAGSGIKILDTSLNNAMVMDKNGIVIHSGASIKMTSGNTNAMLMNDAGISIYSGAGITLAYRGTNANVTRVSLSDTGIIVYSGADIAIRGGSVSIYSGNNSVMAMDSSGIAIYSGGSIAMMSGSTNMMTLDDSGISMQSGANIDIYGGNIRMISGNTNAMVMSNSGIAVYSGADITVNGGSITMVSNNANTMVMDNAGITVYSGANIAVQGGSISIVSGGSNRMVMNSSGIEVYSGANLNIYGGKVAIVSGGTDAMVMNANGITVHSGTAITVDGGSIDLITSTPTSTSTMVKMDNTGIIIYAGATISLKNGNDNRVTLNYQGIGIYSGANISIANAGGTNVIQLDSSGIGIYTGAALNIAGGSINLKSGNSSIIEMNSNGIMVYSAGNITFGSQSTLYINSGAGIKIWNNGGTGNAVYMDRTGIGIYSGASIAIHSSGSLSIESGGTFSVLNSGNTTSAIVMNSSGIGIYSGAGIEIHSGGNITIDSGGTFSLTSSGLNISSSSGYVQAGAWEINNTGLFYYDTDSTDGHVYKFAISNWSAANKHAFTYTDMTSNVSVGIMMVYNSAANKIEISRTANSGQIVLHVYDVHANIFTGGDVYYDNLNQNSSRDIKYDIKPIEQAGERLDELQPVSFKYYNDEKRRTHLGLIYEDTIGIMPEICTVVERDGTKAISYIELVPILLKEIQELRSRVKALEEKEEG